MAKQTKIDPKEFPTAYSYGANSLGPKNIFTERQDYDNRIFADSLAPFMKTWTTDRFYGLVNTLGNSTIPSKVYMKPLIHPYEQENPQYALNFVADAWADFARKARELSNENLIFRDSPWAAPRAVKGWTPLEQEYEGYMQQVVYPAFHDFMRDGDNNSKIDGFPTFLEMFHKFFEERLSKAGPLTLSGMIEGSTAPLYGSGLIIEFGADDYDQDFDKAYKYGDRNFAFMAQIAAQYGFAVDKNIPWRLVADLENPSMREYMHGIPIQRFELDNALEEECDPIFVDPSRAPKGYGFSQLPGFEDVIRRVNLFLLDGRDAPLSGYPQYQDLKDSPAIAAFREMYASSYYETWALDMEQVAAYLVTFYNIYVAQQPTVTLPLPSESYLKTECDTSDRIIRRSPLTIAEYNEMCGYPWQLKNFYVLRLLERQIDTPLPRRKHDIQQIMNIYNTAKITHSKADAYILALRFIQEDILGPYDTSPLTLEFVGDIIDRKRGESVFPNSR